MSETVAKTKTLFVALSAFNPSSLDTQEYLRSDLPQRWARRPHLYSYIQSEAVADKKIKWPQVKGLRINKLSNSSWTLIELEQVASACFGFFSRTPEVDLSSKDRVIIDSLQSIPGQLLWQSGDGWPGIYGAKTRYMVLLKRDDDHSLKLFLKFVQQYLWSAICKDANLAARCYQLMHGQVNKIGEQEFLPWGDYDIALVLAGVSADQIKQALQRTRIYAREQSEYLDSVLLISLDNTVIGAEHKRPLLPATQGMRIPKPRLEPVNRQGILPAPERSKQNKGANVLRQSMFISTHAPAPEDVVCDEQGLVYYGLENGDVCVFNPHNNHHSILINTGGRPLGLACYEDSLYICDAHKGLLKWDRVKQELSCLVAHFNGRPLRFCSNVVRANDGTLWFTQSTNRYDFEQYLGALMEHRPSGQLFKLDINGQLHLVLDKLHFPNGVTLDSKGQSVIYAETGSYSISRYWLTGKKKGSVEIIADNLPGIPDNLSKLHSGRFWVALVAPRNSQLDKMATMFKWLRRLIWRLPEGLSPKPAKTAWVMAFDENGSLLMDIQFHDERFFAVTGVAEHQGQLFLGSMSAQGLFQGTLEPVLTTS